MSEEAISHWGADEVDINEHSLPGLKARFVVGHVPGTGKVLEIGAGEGKILRTLKRHHPALELHGCDVRTPMTQPDVYRFHKMDRNVEMPDGSMDTVLIFDVLEHVPDPAHMLDEVARLLRPGGRFVAFIPIEGERASFYEMFRRLLGKDVYVRAKEHIQAFTHAEIERLLAPRFEVDEIRYAYHLLGHFMDAAFFGTAARMQSLRNFWWRDNVYYNSDKKNEGGTVGVLNRLLVGGNAVAWAESTLLSRTRFGTAGVLVSATVRPRRATTERASVNGEATHSLAG